MRRTSSGIYPRYAPEALERRLNPSFLVAVQVYQVPTTPGAPVPTPPKLPGLPPGDGTPPISGPSVPGGTGEPA